jgi:hypothetical protein
MGFQQHKKSILENRFYAFKVSLKNERFILLFNIGITCWIFIYLYDKLKKEDSKGEFIIGLNSFLMVLEFSNKLKVELKVNICNSPHIKIYSKIIKIRNK